MSNDYNPWAEPPKSDDGSSHAPSQQPTENSGGAPSYSGPQQPYESAGAQGFGGATAASPRPSGAPEQTAFLPTQPIGVGQAGQPGPYAGPSGPAPMTQPSGPGMQPSGFAPQSAISDDGGFKTLFDLSFRRYATPTLAKIIYILVLVTAGLWWLGLALIMLLGGSAASSYSNDSSMLVPGVLWLLFGWIPALLMVCYARVLLELGIANIRTAQDADALRRKLGA